MMGLGFMDNSKGSKAHEESHKQLLEKREIEKAKKDREEKEKKNKW
jgi:hypothetical protein